MTDAELRKIWWKGWNQENDVYSGRLKPLVFSNELAQRAYDSGRWYMRAGDEMPSLDAKPWKEILKEIRNEKNT